MITWNFQYISKTRLAETLKQFSHNTRKGDILIRIHTAIHTGEEAVDLAKYIKTIVPDAHIFGTSTSAAICWGRLVQNQCIISVTKMSGGTVRSTLLPTFDDSGKPVPPEILALNAKAVLTGCETKMLLTFTTRKYLDIVKLIDKCNEYFPEVQMTGGFANISNVIADKMNTTGFVFNENMWTDKGLLLASIGGSELECYSSYATGAQAIGAECEITDSFGGAILSIDNKDAVTEYYTSVGNDADNPSDVTELFPYVSSEASDIPIFMVYFDKTSLNDLYGENSPIFSTIWSDRKDLDKDEKRKLLCATYNLKAGQKLRRAFIYDRKIISDNHALFRHIENFEKAETIFGYSCIARSTIYSNCMKWEISAYANSNMCGCIVEGEIVHVNGQNRFANLSFVVSALGEAPCTQEYNPYAFSHTDSLAADNQELLNYLYEVENKLSLSSHEMAADKMKVFVRDCELKLLYSENEDIPNAAALNMDVKLKYLDRICMINVFDINSMETVFSKHMIKLTYKNYISSCANFAKQKHYTFYIISDWQVAIAAPSYMVSLAEFTEDMEYLQRSLFEATAEYIAIVPIFCVLNKCTVDTLYSAYYSARIEMMQKNIQFYVRDATYGQLDEDSIRERYHMVNVINYAIAHDKVIPYFQGVYDNATNSIHHYEALMRLEDEKGKVYLPASFLEVARSYGLLYDTISKIMLSKVFEKFSAIEDKSVSVNISVRDLKNSDLISYIYDFLSTAKHPENFVFEILENEDIEDYDELIGFVDKIHSLGAQISVDDFGSGFSNLLHIANIHSDYLKIDGSIVKRCCDDQESRNLIALVANWKELCSKKFGIIAEFVENDDIQKVILNFNIDYSQGFLFSTPEPDIKGL